MLMKGDHLGSPIFVDVVSIRIRSSLSLRAPDPNS